LGTWEKLDENTFRTEKKSKSPTPMHPNLKENKLGHP
jgi:hypothetical protein